MRSRSKAVSVIPSYLMVLVVMTIVGVVLAGIVAQVYLPLTKQRGYYGRSIEYRYTIDKDNVIITIANRKNYEAKVDVVLIDQNNRVLTSCNGLIKSSLSNKTRSGAISLLGLTIEPREIVTIVCSNNPPIKNVKVYEYGVPEGRQGKAFVGKLSFGYYAGAVGFSLNSPWQFSLLYFRLPITVIATKTYAPAYIEVVLSPRTLPSDVWNFFKTHVQPDVKDVLVVGTDGTRYPTKANRHSDSIVVYFKVDKLTPGVHRYYLYFGNPQLSSPLYPLKDNIRSSKLITTPSPLPNTITRSMAYPAYLIPEANWLPKNDGIRYGVVITRERSKFYYDIYVPVRDGNAAKIKKLIDEAMKNPAYFPVGTVCNNWDYRNLHPKTRCGWAPWGVATVVQLPRITLVPKITTITTMLWVSSDDGAAAYLVAYKGSNLVYRIKYFDRIYDAHGPRYWNYPAIRRSLNANKTVGADLYLIVLTQNGILSGCCPGYQDFRFIMWYIEQATIRVPSTKEFLSLYQPYIEVVVHGLPNKDLRNYAFPVDLTGRSDVDWSIFDKDSVYVVDDKGRPVYYWVQVEDGRTIVWFRIDYLPARSTKIFRIYYGGTNKYPSYNNPEKVFAFFDDFSKNPIESGKWKIYSRKGAYRWDSVHKIFYLIYNKRHEGVAMFMNLDWKKSFHVHFRFYISGAADGMTFAFFKDTTPYLAAKPLCGGTLALDVPHVRGIHSSKGYAVEFDIYRNRNGRRWSEPPAPHIALVETFSSWDVADNTHHAVKVMNFKNKWHSVDIYYYNGRLDVYLDHKLVLTYSGGIFSKYGIRYGGIGFTAATGGLKGVFAIDTVFLRYYPGQEPSATIKGYKPAAGSGAEIELPTKVYDFETDRVVCYKPSAWQWKCEIKPSGFWYYCYRTSGGYYGARLVGDAYHGSKALLAYVGDYRNNPYYLAFTAEVRFPTPLPMIIEFYYKSSLQKLGRGWASIKVQGYTGSSWKDIAKLSTSTRTWKRVVIDNANLYSAIRVFLYVYTPVYTRDQALLNFWLDYVIYKG